MNLPLGGRILFTLALLASFIELTLNLPAGTSPLSPRWSVPSLVFLVAALGFAHHVWPGRFALLAFLSFALLSFQETSLWPGDVGVRHAGRLAVATLGGWFIAYVFTHRQTPTGRAICAHHAACGIAAAGYVIAGITKLHLSGTSFIDGGNLALLVAERSFDGPGWLQGLRAWVASQAILCSVLASFALTLELCGVAFLWPRARRTYTVVAATFQVGVILLLGYLVLEWVILLAALAFFPPRDA